MKAEPRKAIKLVRLSDQEIEGSKQGKLGRFPAASIYEPEEEKVSSIGCRQKQRCDK